MNFWDILILFFSFQAMLLSVLFFVRKNGDKRSNKVFAFFLFLFSFNLFYNVLYWSRIDIQLFVHICYTYSIPISLYGGTFYLYTRTITSGKKLKWRDLIHFIPLVVILYIFGPFYILPLNEKIEALNTIANNPYVTYVKWVSPISVLIMLFYSLYTYFKLIRNYACDPEMAIWLKSISFSFLLFVLSHLIHRILFYSSVINLEFDYFITLFMIVLIGLVCYFAFVHSSVFNGMPLNNAIPFIKYEKTGLSREFSNEMKEKLLVLMSTERPYLNPEIRLDKIAEMLDVSRHHASQIINEHFTVNFFDFINQYRIKEAEKLLNSELSITDVAFESGFNNRISFYKAFKKILGTTPSQYREHNITP